MWQEDTRRRRFRQSHRNPSGPGAGDLGARRDLELQEGDLDIALEPADRQLVVGRGAAVDPPIGIDLFGAAWPGNRLAAPVDILSRRAARHPPVVGEIGGGLALILGTGWGLEMSVISKSDQLLAPLRGPGDFNHLSVRSALAAILDRLFGIPTETHSIRGPANGHAKA